MVMASPATVLVEKKSLLGYIAAFMLHTYVAYSCAMHVSQRLVFYWFGWVAPILHVPSIVPATDWYLKHFELMTILPALVIGYVNVARILPDVVRNFMYEEQHSIATWAWTFPTFVLLYKMLEYHVPSSVLFGGSMTAMKYFFEIQTVMPTLQNPLASDPVRVGEQMLVTAPFYAGIAYSLGALVSKHHVLTKLFTFETHDEMTSSKEP
jgi:hypothetical protein